MNWSLAQNTHKAQHPILKGRTRLFLAGLVVCILGFGIFFVESRTGPHVKNRMLNEVFGQAAHEMQLIASGQERGVLFGDSQYAWHVRFKESSTHLPAQARLADKSDLEFSMRCIEQLLGESLRGLKVPSVHRMEVGRPSVYLVRDDAQVEDVYIYLIVN
jgi:hypothetical protein